MHQLEQHHHVGGCCKASFTDTLIISNPERLPGFNTEVVEYENLKSQNLIYY